MRARVALVSLSLSLLFAAGGASAQKPNIPPPPAPSASPSANTPSSGTPTMDEQLMWAIDEGSCTVSMVDSKLLGGADPNFKNAGRAKGIRVGDNALVAALIRPCDEKVIKHIVKGEVPVNINKANVKKADVEATGKDGVTPLVLAVKLDDVSLVKLILEAGANPDRKMVSTDPALNGKTAFDFLAGKKHEKRMRKALKKERD
ncbi:MAG: hypothetical protein U0169_10720 [Polyangiaceae bacterium]